jgi:hypothetical protein
MKNQFGSVARSLSLDSIQQGGILMFAVLFLLLAGYSLVVFHLQESAHAEVRTDLTGHETRAGFEMVVESPFEP